MHRLKEQLIKHEGIKLRPYYCSAGKLTIGVGRNLYSRGISRGEAMLMLDNDIQNAKEEIHWLFDHWDIPIWKANVPRQHALMNLAFNMGLLKLEEFKRMWRAIRDEDWDLAARELLDSKYADQVGDRAIELAEQLRKGSYK